MTKLMSAEEILAEFNARQFVDGAHTEAEHAWFRTALAAHTAWLMERFPKRSIAGRCANPEGCACIDSCLDVLQQEINDLTK